MDEPMLKRDAAMWRNADPPSGSTCIDAETLAAWAEGALTPAESALVETHLADCARCQEMAAMFAMSEPVSAATAPATVLPWPRRYWMPIAGAAIAASILVAVMVRPQKTTPTVTTEIAEASAPVVSPPPPEGAISGGIAGALPTGSPTAPKSMPAPQATGTDRTRTLAAASPSPAQTPTAPPAPAQVLAATPPPAAPAPLVIPPKAEAVLTAPVLPPVAEPRPAPPPPPPAPLLPQSAVAVTAAPPVAGNRVGFTSSLSDAVASRATATAVTGKNIAMAGEPIVEFAAPKRVADAAAGGRGGGGGRGGAAPSALSVAVNSGSTLRWRVKTPTRVERSIDDGMTWVAVDLGPETVEITNGVAPAPLTCWLVGRAGVVYRSVDGTTFVRIAFPETLDLVAIVSINAASATVTATGGRQFATTDAGRTWNEIK